MALRVLCVHGIGHHDPNDLTWQQAWVAAVNDAVGATANVQFCETDELFSRDPLTAWQTFEAIATLGGNAIFGTGQRGLFDGDNLIGWTAGMVTQWAGNEALRKACRDRLRDRIKAVKPDVIVAHSLGSLIAYDLLSGTDGAGIVAGQTLITIGSQINSRLVAGIFERGVVPLAATARWFHVFNPNDRVFTARITFDGATNFLQVVTKAFGTGLIGGHTDIHSYLNDDDVKADVWTAILSAAPSKSKGIAVTREVSVARALQQKSAPTFRALLVGINEYKNPDNRLDGCVNDVFNMSQLLQECLFSPDDIRVLLDTRATGDAIRDHLSWLFTGVNDGDVRILYFSGHGIQIPAYGKDNKPARMYEALVPTDFDGNFSNCISDYDLRKFYSSLSREARAILVFDCCHAGGLTRAGGPKIRGIDPPDDVRHRMLRWDIDEQMWVPRDFVKRIPDSDTTSDRVKNKNPHWKEASGSMSRLGCSLDQSRLSDDDYDRLRKETGWKGPYLPMIVTACKENQKSSEYLHGSVSYGAFTYALCRTIRQAAKDKDSISYNEAVERAGKTLERLGYLQTPGLTAPPSLKKDVIPLLAYLSQKVQSPKKTKMKAKAAAKEVSTISSRKKQKNSRKKKK